MARLCIVRRAYASGEPSFTTLRHFWATRVSVSWSRSSARCVSPVRRYAERASAAPRAHPELELLHAPIHARDGLNGWVFGPSDYADYPSPSFAVDSSRICTLRILPVTVMGNSSTTMTYRGIL